MRKAFTDIYYIAKMDFLMLRESFIATTIVSIIIPLGMTYIVSLAAADWPKETLVNYMAGILILSSSLTLINGVGQTIAQDKHIGRLSWLRTCPIHPFAYVLGKTTTYIFGALVNLVAILFLGGVLWRLSLGFYVVGITILVLFLAGLSLIGIGAIIGSRSRTLSGSYAIGNIVSFVLAFATPAYYSLETLPKAVRPFTFILPTTAASEIFKKLLLDNVINKNLIFLLIILCLIYLFFGFRGIKWREV